MQFMETKIVRNVAAALIMAGMPVTVDDGDGDGSALTDSTDIDAIEKAAFEFDECWLLANPEGPGYNSFVKFVFGNGDGGLCVISDYSVDLQDVLQPVLDEIEAISDRGQSFTACSEFQALTEIVRECVFGDSTPDSQQRLIDLCRAARERFGIERKEA